jgi:hypothetical protein
MAKSGRRPSSGELLQPAMEVGPRSPSGPRLVDQAHEILSSKINLKFDYSRNFAKGPLGFFEIKPQSTKFQQDRWFSKIIPNLVLATSRKYR